MYRRYLGELGFWGTAISSNTSMLCLDNIHDLISCWVPLNVVNVRQYPKHTVETRPPFCSPLTSELLCLIMRCSHACTWQKMNVSSRFSIGYHKRHSRIYCTLRWRHSGKLVSSQQHTMSVCRNEWISTTIFASHVVPYQLTSLPHLMQ